MRSQKKNKTNVCQRGLRFPLRSVPIGPSAGPEIGKSGRPSPPCAGGGQLTGATANAPVAAAAPTPRQDGPKEARGAVLFPRGHLSSPLPSRPFVYMPPSGVWRHPDPPALPAPSGLWPSDRGPPPHDALRPAPAVTAPPPAAAAAPPVPKVPRPPVVTILGQGPPLRIEPANKKPPGGSG